MEGDRYQAVLRYAPIAPRKLRYTIDQIRGKSVNEALSTLKIITKRGAYYVNKLLNSAVANASNIDTDLDADNLQVAEARVDPGPYRKKFRAASMGRGMTMRKRTSHIFIALVPTDEEGEAPKPKPAEAKKAPAEAAKAETKAQPAAKAEEKPKKSDAKGKKE